MKIGNGVMKLRKYVRAFILVFLISSCIVKWLPLQVSSEPDLPVHNVDTGLDYATIQEAINANETLDGHTIRVDAGTYYEHVFVDKALSIVGHDKFNTIIDGNGTGIVVHVQPNGVMITGFTIQNGGNVTGCSGIHVEGSYTNMSHIIIRNAYRGIIIIGSSRNVLSDIQASNNTYGIYLYYSSNNVLSDIQLSMNDQGIALFRSENNMIFHNNFLNNTGSLSSDGSVNFLDNGVEGNYWSDYRGVDDDQDGVGDTPYVINQNNTDHFPLMGLFFGFKVVYEDKKFLVSVISNSMVSDLYFNETVKMLNFNIVNRTVAFCRVMLAKVLVNEPYLVLINGDRVNSTVLPVSNGTHAFLYFTCILSNSRKVSIVSKPFYELMEKYDALLANYYILNSTFYELYNNYTILLGDYNKLKNDYKVLNATYHEVLQNYTELHENYVVLQLSYNILLAQYDLLNSTFIGLNMTYNELKVNFTKLQGSYDSLHISYSTLLAQYDLLNSAHADLLASYNELESNYEGAINELTELKATYYEVLGNYTRLKSDQEATKSELGFIKNLMYVFVTAALVAVVLLSFSGIRYYRLFQRQKKVIDIYEGELRRMSPLEIARALFQADVERRGEKIAKFEEKYGVKVQPRSTLEDIIRSLEVKKKVKD